MKKIMDEIENLRNMAAGCINHTKNNVNNADEAHRWLAKEYTRTIDNVRRELDSLETE